MSIRPSDGFRLNDFQQSILVAFEALLRATNKEKNGDFAAFAYRVDEQFADEVIYPAVVLIGKYLQDKRPN